MSDNPDWCTCEHSDGEHEFGVCQMVVGGSPSRPELCPCENPNYGND